MAAVKPDRRRRVDLTEAEIAVLLEELEAAKGGRWRLWNSQRTEALASARAKLHGRQGIRR